VESRLDGLYLGKLIERDVYEAALAVKRDHDFAAGLDTSPVARIGMPSIGLASRLDAAARLRRIKARIGPGAYALAIACCAEDRSWRQIGDSSIAET